MSNPQITFASSANQSAVSLYSLEVIKNLLIEANCPSCKITSTSRTPEEQARVMFNNIVNATNGVANQLALYGPAGDQVINEYVRAKNAGANKDAILTAMTAKINAVGASNVSHHCADLKTINVIDIAPSSIIDKNAFLKAIENAESRGIIARHFSPSNNDPAFHIEIRQKQ